MTRALYSHPAPPMEKWRWPFFCLKKKVELTTYGNAYAVEHGSMHDSSISASVPTQRRGASGATITRRNGDGSTGNKIGNTSESIGRETLEGGRIGHERRLKRNYLPARSFG